MFHKGFAKQGRSEDSSSSPTDATKVISGLVGWCEDWLDPLDCLACRAGSQLGAVLGRLELNRPKRSRLQAYRQHGSGGTNV